jgi:hypothetical protein
VVQKHLLEKVNLSSTNVFVKKSIYMHGTNKFVFKVNKSSAKYSVKKSMLYVNHRYRKSLNRLLKVCYVPPISAAFFSSFFLWPLTVLMKQTRQLAHSVKQSIYLDVYGVNLDTAVKLPADFTAQYFVQVTSVK